MWQKLQQRLGQSRGVLIITASVAGLIIVGSQAGLFRLLEWAIFDQFVLWRKAEPIDQRIVIVTIAESDINYVRKWPMSDRVMARFIRNIKAQQPRAIGIDIYRDLPVEPGHEELVEVFKSTPNLIGIEKVGGEPIAPPPTLRELEQVAAADLVLDADGKVRRGLVLVGNKKGEFREGLGTKTALMYLEKENINLRLLNQEQKIYGLGKATFVPLAENEGVYHQADMGGYQILLNYRGELDRFPNLSLQDVLENRIPEGMMRDRIVLVGATAPSLNDLFQSPYTSKLFGVSELTPGVVIHANMASQILSAAIEGRPLMRAWGQPLNSLWIVFWSGCSANLGSMYLRRRWATIGIFIAAGSVAIISYVAFLSGWWIPAFAPLLSVVTSAIVTIGYVLLKNLRLSYRQLEEYAQTLEQKVEERTAQLAQANQEITALNEKLKAENIRLNAELEITKRLQQMILPKQAELEQVEGLEIAGFMEPAEQVGGDYYDVLPANGQVKISIGDVTGHGLESGVLMLMTQTAVRTLQESKITDPVQFLDILNRTIYHNIERMRSDKNLTLAVLDYAKGKLNVSGQHEETIVVRADGNIERVDTVDLGFPIGLDAEIAEFVSQIQIQLNYGDVVVLYTDGITEAEDMKSNLYGIEKLCEIVKENRQLSAKEIRQLVIEDVRQHIGKQKIFDDITLVVLKQK